jgi:prevent-host-death family protein
VDIGVRELKEHLSEILERAAAGEIIRVTDRGRPKALLGPVPGVASLAAGVAAGWIRPGDGSPPQAARRHPSARGALDVLAHDREDR